MLIKKSSTAFPLVFFMVDSSDHVTGKTGLSPTVTISKAGGSFGSPSGSVSEIANGWYKVAGNATDSGTDGALALHATATGADPTDMLFEVVAFDPQDAVRLGLTALPNAAAEAAGGLYTRGTGAGQINQPANGQVDANTVKVGGTTQTARDLGASVLLSSGTGTGQLDFTSGVVKSNLVQILATALTETAGQIAAAFKKFFDNATPTGTVNSLPDAVPGAANGLPTTNGTKVNQTVDLTAGQTVAATVAGSVGSVVGNVGGNVVGSVASVTAAVTVGTNNDKTGYGLSSAAVQSIWDALTSALTTVGSIGKKLADWVVGTIDTYTGNTKQTGDAYPIVNHADYGNAKLVRSTTPANTLDISATGEAGLDFNNIKDAAGAHTLSNITVPTVTDLTNAPTNGDFTTAMKTSITTAATAATPTVAAVTADVGITQAAADKVWNTAARTLTSFGTLVADTATAVWGAAARTLTSFGTLVDEIWDEALSGHTTAGTAGKALSDAGAGGDPAAIADAVWDEVLSGHSGAGSSGQQLSATRFPDGVVYHDGTTGEAGTAYPLGTTTDPVNNLPDAILIANANKLNIISTAYNGDETIPNINQLSHKTLMARVKNFQANITLSLGQGEVNFIGQILDMGGDEMGACVFQDCYIHTGGTYAQCFFYDSYTNETGLDFSIKNSDVFRNCCFGKSRDADYGVGFIDVTAGDTGEFLLDKCTGHIRIKNLKGHLLITDFEGKIEIGVLTAGAVIQIKGGMGDIVIDPGCLATVVVEGFYPESGDTGLTAQEVRDALQLSPTTSSVLPEPDSIDDKLDNIIVDSASIAAIKERTDKLQFTDKMEDVSVPWITIDRMPGDEAIVYTTNLLDLAGYGTGTVTIDMQIGTTNYFRDVYQVNPDHTITFISRTYVMPYSGGEGTLAIVSTNGVIQQVWGPAPAQRMRVDVNSTQLESHYVDSQTRGMDTDVMTADALKADAVTEIQSGLATELNATANKQAILDALPDVSGLATELNATANKEAILDAIDTIPTEVWTLEGLDALNEDSAGKMLWKSMAIHYVPFRTWHPSWKDSEGVNSIWIQLFDGVGFDEANVIYESRAYTKDGVTNPTLSATDLSARDGILPIPS